MIDKNELSQKVIKHFGIEHQLKKVVEECSELISVIMHYDDDRATLFEVAGEAADVENVVNHLRLIIKKLTNGKDLVSVRKKQKLKRLKRILKDEK